jgi:iron(III) transport system substrate-binding protein
MKKLLYFQTVFMAVILSAVLLSSNVFAAAQMTALEEKLYKAAKEEGKLIWWDTGSLRDSVHFIKAFNARYPGIEVTYYEVNADNSDEKYFMERQAGRNPVDLKHTANYPKYQDEGLLDNMSDIIKDTGYPEAFCTKDFDAVGIEHTVKGTAYNTNLVSAKDVPRSWDDLLDPKWKGKINMDYRLKIFSFQTWTWGEDNIIAYLKKLREQNPTFSSGVTKTMTLLGAGEFAISTDSSLGVVIKLQKKGLPIAMAPINPVVSQFNPHILVKHSPHPNAARLFLRWLMTADGQKLVDDIREKGSPMPGSGTSQAIAIEKAGLKLEVFQEWRKDLTPIEKRYQQAVGYKGKKKK